MLTVKFKKLSSTATLPKYMSLGAAGMDIYCDLIKPVHLCPDCREVIPTGLAVEIPLGYEGQVRTRSGRAAAEGLTVLNSPGTIDSDFRGEIKVILHNGGNTHIDIQPGSRIAQLVLAPVWRPEVEEVSELTATLRGDGGFGHTGV